MTWLMGPVASLFAATATRVNPIEVEDCAVASLVLAVGALASLAATLGSQQRDQPASLLLRACDVREQPGALCARRRPLGDHSGFRCGAARIAEGLRDWSFVPSRFNGLMAAYHAALEGGAELPVTLADARQSLELVTALFYSAETGAPVTLPIDAAHPKYRDWRPANKARP